MDTYPETRRMICELLALRADLLRIIVNMLARSPESRSANMQQRLECLHAALELDWNEVLLLDQSYRWTDGQLDDDVPPLERTHAAG